MEIVDVLSLYKTPNKHICSVLFCSVAALEEVKIRQSTLDSTHLQRLMLDLVGNPLRAKMAKEATSS